MINREYNKTLKAYGKKVVLRKLERYHEREVEGIFIPGSLENNSRLCKAVVESVGPDAKWTKLIEGDIVLYDTMSVFYDTHPCVVTNSENVIAVIDENHLTPIGNGLLCTREEYDKNNDGIILPDTVEEICPIYSVVRLGLGEYGNIKVCDKVIANIGDKDFIFTSVTFKGKEYRILDYSNIIAKII